MRGLILKHLGRSLRCPAIHHRPLHLLKLFQERLFGNEEPCTVGELNPSEPTLIGVLRTSHETALVVGEGEVGVQCGSAIECVYNGENLVGIAKGPLLSTAANGEVTLTEQPTHVVKGAFCPSEAN